MAHVRVEGTGDGSPHPGAGLKSQLAVRPGQLSLKEVSGN